MTSYVSIRQLPAWKENRLNYNVAIDGSKGFYITERCGHTAVCFKDDLIIFGGYHEISDDESSYNCASVLWSYNVNLDRWTRVITSGHFPEPISGCVSALVWPYWYITCGHANDGYSTAIYRINLVTLVWECVEVEGKTISPRDKSVSWVFDSRIYVHGGFGSEPNQHHLWNKKDVFLEDESFIRGWNDQLLYFDLATKQWHAPECLGKKPKARAAHSAVRLDTTIYLFGGRHDSRRVNDLHLLDLATHTWKQPTVLGEIPTGRSWHAMSVFGPSQLILHGGFDTSCTPLDDTWVLDTKTLSWTALRRNTGVFRLWHTMSVTDSQDVLLFGGCTNNILAETKTITSSEVVLFRRQPFSLERLCLHKIYSMGSYLESEWPDLPEEFREFLQLRLALDSDQSFQPHRFKNVCHTAFGPDVAHLCVLTKQQADARNRRNNFSQFLFHAFS